MSKYGKLNQQEATALLFQKDVIIGDLNKKNEKLEAAQNAFMFEIKETFKTFAGKSKFMQFVGGAVVAYRVFKTSQEYFKETEAAKEVQSDNDLAKHLIN